MKLSHEELRKKLAAQGYVNISNITGNGTNYFVEYSRGPAGTKTLIVNATTGKPIGAQG